MGFWKDVLIAAIAGIKIDSETRDSQSVTIEVLDPGNLGSWKFATRALDNPGTVTQTMKRIRDEGPAGRRVRAVESNGFVKDILT